MLGEQFGSAITFGQDNNSSAPGQIEVHALKEVLKVIHHNN
ncbi:MAG: type I 3-dehydroquinate dehydratase [Thomasclavelia ramosa]|nr:type I 3-dehydroquinate dehydratase [Thomasclavelia ramosa]